MRNIILLINTAYRTFDENYINILNNIRELFTEDEIKNIICTMHTWEQIDGYKCGKPTPKTIDYFNGIFKSFTYDVSDPPADDLYKWLKSKDRTFKAIAINRLNAFSMEKALSICPHIISDNDVVVRFRPDIFLTQDADFIHLKEKIKNISLNTLVSFPNTKDRHYDEIKNNELGDLFFITTVGVIRKLYYTIIHKKYTTNYSYDQFNEKFFYIVTKKSGVNIENYNNGCVTVLRNNNILYQCS